MEKFQTAVRARESARVTGNRSLTAASFIDRAIEILTECQNRKRTGHHSPFDSAIGFMKRECYALILKTKKHGGHVVIKNLSRYDRREPPQPLYAENPFFWGLLAIDPDLGTVGRKDHRFVSDQFLYAERHKISPEHLVGFLYQSGSQTLLRKRVKLNQYDDEFILSRNRHNGLRAFHDS